MQPVAGCAEVDQCARFAGPATDLAGHGAGLLAVVDGLLEAPGEHAGVAEFGQGTDFSGLVADLLLDVQGPPVLLDCVPEAPHLAVDDAEVADGVGLADTITEFPGQDVRPLQAVDGFGETV